MLQSNVLRKLNFLIFILLSLFAIIFQSTFFGSSLMHFLQPDFLLIIAIYLGLRRGPIEGSALVILISIMAEAHSGAAKSVYLTVYLYTFIASKIFTTMMVVPNILASIGLVAGMTLLKKVIILLLLGVSGKISNGLHHFLVSSIPAMLVHSLLAPFCFAFFSKIDFFTEKTELAPGELDTL